MTKQRNTIGMLYSKTIHTSAAPDSPKGLGEAPGPARSRPGLRPPLAARAEAK